MSTVDRDADGLVVHTRDAPETVLPCCTRMRGPQGSAGLLEAAARVPLHATLDHDSARGLRVLAIARRTLDQGQPAPVDRAQVESELELIGVVGMVDPPRPGVADAVARAYRPGIRIPVVTGDYGPTAAEIARQVGIGHTGSRIVTADELDRPRRRAARRGVRRHQEIVFARTSAEGKLRICGALQARGQIAAMTGDGVNDAPRCDTPSARTAFRDRETPTAGEFLDR